MKSHYTRSELAAFDEGFNCVTQESGVRADNPYTLDDSNLAQYWSDGFDSGVASMDDPTEPRDYSDTADFEKIADHA